MPTTRHLLTVSILAAFSAASGCSVIRYARLVCIEEPKQFCERRDDVASMATYRSWADAAWAEQSTGCPEGCLEADYAWGFREGFAEFVYGGGTGQPPAVPPRPYWQTDLRTPEGAAAVESWFAGYRHGVQTAREGGYRSRVTLKLSASLKDCDACGCPDEEALGSGAPQIGPAVSPPALFGPTLEPVLPEPTGPASPQVEEVPTEVRTLPKENTAAWVPTEALEPRVRLLSEPDRLAGPDRNAQPAQAIFQIVR